MTKAYPVVWDSCVVIDYLRKHEERFPLIQPMIDQAEKGELKIVVSEITPAEVLTLEKLGGLTANEITEHAGVIADFFERSYVVGRIVDRSISTAAARLRRKHHPLSTCDSLILATALQHKVPVVYTFDGDTRDGSPKNGRLIALDGKIPMSADGHCLRIMKPAGRADGQTSIDDIVMDESKPAAL